MIIKEDHSFSSSSIIKITPHQATIFRSNSILSNKVFKVLISVEIIHCSRNRQMMLKIAKVFILRQRDSWKMSKIALIFVHLLKKCPIIGKILIMQKKLIILTKMIMLGMLKEIVIVISSIIRVILHQNISNKECTLIKILTKICLLDFKEKKRLKDRIYKAENNFSQRRRRRRKKTI